MPLYKKSFNTSNDGAGSGLDADLLDGQQGSYYTTLQNSIAGVSGDIIYHNGTAWTNLAKGTTGQILEINASGFPAWVNKTIG